MWHDTSPLNSLGLTFLTRKERITQPQKGCCEITELIHVKYLAMAQSKQQVGASITKLLFMATPPLASAETELPKSYPFLCSHGTQWGSGNIWYIYIIYTHTHAHIYLYALGLTSFPSHSVNIALVIKQQRWVVLQPPRGFLAKEQMPMICNFCSFSQQHSAQWITI